MLRGISKKSICLKAPENFFSKSFESSLEKANDIEGKIAVDKETATALIAIEERFPAKLKTATLPVAKVEAMAVITIVFICPAPNPIDLGAISFNVFTTPLCPNEKIFWPGIRALYRNPE